MSQRNLVRPNAPNLDRSVLRRPRCGRPRCGRRRSHSLPTTASNPWWARAALALALSTTAIGGSSTAFAKDPETVSASDKAAARAAMDEGHELYNNGKYGAALAKYQEADAIMGVPTTGNAVGKSFEAMGKLVEARDAYLGVGRYRHTPGKSMPTAFVDAMKHASEREADIATKIPTLVIAIEGLPAGVSPTVLLNGEAINAASLTRRVNPGEVTVSASAPGYIAASATALLTINDKQTVTLELKVDPDATGASGPIPGPVPDSDPVPVPIPGPDPGTERDGGTLVPAAVAFAIGGAGLVAGAITGGLTFAKESELETTCNGTPQNCPQGSDLIDEANTLAWVSNISFGVGGLGVAAGIVLIFVFQGDDDPEESAITPIVSPDMFGVAGRF